MHLLQCLSSFVLVILCSYSVAATAAGNCRIAPAPADSCCDFPKHEHEAEVIDSCVKTYAAQVAREMTAPRSPGDPMRGCCIAECIMNGTGHTELTADKLAQTDIAEAKAMGMGDDWTTVIENTAKFCANEGEKRAAEFEQGFLLPPLEPTDPVCHPKYVHMLICITMNNLMNCPAKYYKATPECDSLKEFYKSCAI